MKSHQPMIIPLGEIMTMAYTKNDESEVALGKSQSRANPIKEEQEEAKLIAELGERATNSFKTSHGIINSLRGYL